MGDKTIFSDEHKRNLSKSLKGKQRTDEQKARIAAGRRAYLEKVKEAMVQAPRQADTKKLIEALENQLDLFREQLEAIKKSL